MDFAGMPRIYGTSGLKSSVSSDLGNTSRTQAKAKKPVFFANRLKRNIAMLLRRIFVAFGFEHLQGLDQLLARLAGLDDGVDEAPVGCNIGIGEALAKFFDLLLAHFAAIFSPFQFTFVDDIHCAFRSHDGD